MSEEVMYCIWNFWTGRCDSSTNWGKLYDILTKNLHRFKDRKAYIIPVSAVGKGRYMSYKECEDYINRMCYESTKRSRRILND